ncbi:hypothetical protein [Shewanella sp. 10N.286.48.B5]|uniref:hypothetical protein n=1 Tax=Shewanella sp. 10N.286.48.B5 TaxID=1880834 RepID=UPI000C856A26|nr:hypothetical protein [Shewanella sp. 10N.286.48.B5]PMH88205.1 hypothetical protein BCU57_20045 [Shewanella sp. 10N.286.48.B5]
MTIANFDSVPFRDIYGDKKGVITGEFNTQSLSDYLIEYWVSYVECHHCPRENTCKFAIPHPKWEWKKLEILCGVKSEFIRNFVALTFEEYIGADSDAQERLLSATFHLSEYAIMSEQQIGWTIDDEWLKNLGTYGKTFLGNIVHLREKLTHAAQDLSYVPNLYNRKPILLVEGQSEKAFLDKLRESHNSWFTDLRTEVYGGNGNAHPRRIQMRLEKYVEDGYTCFMQGDKDGKEKGSFEKLIKQKVVEEKNTFLFDYDFESAIPRKLLLIALHNLELLLDIDSDAFLEKTDSESSICIQIKNVFELDLEPYKVALADEIGWVFNNSQFHWYQDKSDFMEKTELGRFLDFVIKMH